jgi:hypothetical protein
METSNVLIKAEFSVSINITIIFLGSDHSNVLKAGGILGVTALSNFRLQLYFYGRLKALLLLLLL